MKYDLSGLEAKKKIKKLTREINQALLELTVKDKEIKKIEGVVTELWCLVDEFEDEPPHTTRDTPKQINQKGKKR